MQIRTKFWSNVSVCEKSGTAMAVAAIPLAPALLTHGYCMFEFSDTPLDHKAIPTLLSR